MPEKRITQSRVLGMTFLVPAPALPVPANPHYVGQEGWGYDGRVQPWEALAYRARWPDWWCWGKWWAAIREGVACHELGNFDTEIEAREAFESARLET